MQTILNFDSLRGGQTVKCLIDNYNFQTVLDVGSGSGHQARAFRDHGKEVTETDYLREGDFMEWHAGHYDVVFACHVLEHQPNVNAFLAKCKSHLQPDGIFAVVVPPAKHEIVGGHLTLWNAGLLLYNLILAGFDCSQADLLSYGYNVSVIVKNSEIELPTLNYDCGDVNKLQAFFPSGCSEPFDGRLKTKINTTRIKL